jgi:prevent-host-death family protein
MKKIGITQLKKHFFQVLEEVEQGEEILICRRGTPIAVLVPIGRYEDLVRDCRELRASGEQTSQTEIREWIEKGRE